MKTVSIKVASAVVAGLGLTAGTIGMVSAQTSGEIGGTGEDSSNHVNVDNAELHGTDTSSDVKVQNNNPQSATSGDSKVDDGEDNGTAESGDAGNVSELTGEVEVDQTSAASANSGGSSGGAQKSVNGSINGETGESSTNRVNVSNTVVSANKTRSSVNIQNNNTQTAQSGNATVKGGEDGGSALSGAAANGSKTSFTVNVKQ